MVSLKTFQGHELPNTHPDSLLQNLEGGPWDMLLGFLPCSLVGISSFLTCGQRLLCMG